MTNQGPLGLPPGLGDALRRAGAGGLDMPGVGATPPPGAPPCDAGNALLAGVKVTMEVEAVTIEPGRPDYPGNVAVVPAQAAGPNGMDHVVLFTLRTPSTTMTAFWAPAVARANVDRIREIGREIPSAILPPDVAASGLKVPGIIVPPSAAAEHAKTPDLRRMRLTLRDDQEPGSGMVSVLFEPARIPVVAELIERALYALSGIVMPDQG